MKISIIYHSETGNVKQMAELVAMGCKISPEISVKVMPVGDVDDQFLEESKAVIFGTPTYDGVCSWQLKKYFDSHPKGIMGKLGGVFVSQNWPGGGGASFAEMTVIAAMLIHGMIIFSGGIANGAPSLHFGAVSEKAPATQLYKDRCLKLGSNIAGKALEFYGSRNN